MLGLFSAIGLALASLLVLTPWLISLQDNQRNLSTEGSRAVAQSGSHADQEDLGQSASIGVSVHAQQGHAQPHIETVAVDEDLNDETADRERSLDEKSATAVGLDSEVTDVSYRSSLPLDIRNPLIYHANQAELEGLIDVVEGTPEKKIRIGF